MEERFTYLSVVEESGLLTTSGFRELDELSAIRDQDPKYKDDARKRNEKIQALFDELGIKLKVPLNFQNPP